MLVPSLHCSHTGFNNANIYLGFAKVGRTAKLFPSKNTVSFIHQPLSLSLLFASLNQRSMHVRGANFYQLVSDEMKAILLVGQGDKEPGKSKNENCSERKRIISSSSEQCFPTFLSYVLQWCFQKFRSLQKLKRQLLVLHNIPLCLFFNLLVIG